MVSESLGGSSSPTVGTETKVSLWECAGPSRGAWGVGEGGLGSRPSLEAQWLVGAASATGPTAPFTSCAPTHEEAHREVLGVAETPALCQAAGTCVRPPWEAAPSGAP